MSDKLTVKPPMWFWIVSVIALIWNIMGVMAYLADAFTTVEQLEMMTQEQRHLYESRPAWVTSAFAIAVWGGLLGCIALLLRKKWARPIFLLSLIGILVQNGYYFFMTNATEVFGQFQAIVMPLLVIIIGIALLLFARSSTAKGWLK